MSTNILREIFFDRHNHWEQFVDQYGERIRPVVIKEVEKFRDCGNPENGFKLFVCEGCHDVRKVPYRCRGRFCTICSIGESEEWSRLLTEDVIHSNHRHVILTIDEGLREVFMMHRHLLKPLMDEAAKLVMDYFKKKGKVTPGVIAGLHTFGSQVNFNPHVHMLVSMGGLTDKGKWKSYDYIPFNMLRKQWQTVVLKFIRKNLTSKEKKRVQPILQKAYQNNAEGFYVYAPKQKGKVKDQLRYIGRYMRRPAIGMNRIVKYDGETVTFTYIDKVDGKKKDKTVRVETFIILLIRHIPDEQFKTIRHYGIYSRRTKRLSKKIIAAWQRVNKRWMVKLKKTLRKRTWRERVIDTGEKDPMVCPKCDNYYEYMGEVCLEGSQLVIKVAISKQAKIYLERVIRHFEEKKKTQQEEKRRRPLKEKAEAG